MGKKEFWSFVRENIIGGADEIATNFGMRRVTYADYTASGRGVDIIEEYLKNTLRLYGNTHTTDNATGGVTGIRLHLAEETIKRAFNAHEDYALIPVGTGTTGAIHRLQQILGIYIPPAYKDLMDNILNSFFGEPQREDFESFLIGKRPVVFIGPYEHHSNVISWRECFAEVIDINLGDDGLIDLSDLEKRVSDEKYNDRMKIGSFSAASNVTGIKSPLYDIAQILHRNNAYAFFDCAALAPYNRISIMKDEENYLDGIFFSPHKFLGGPGSSGILLIHEKVYRRDLPPSCAGGGTVDFVNFSTQDYSSEIEIRETPGTPGIIQIMKAALAVELKERLDPDEIEEKENAFITEAFKRLKGCPDVEIVGNTDPDKRIAILSFNIRCGNGYLHPKYVAVLLNDLFGIQSRAGCLCAGPYAHRLFGIDSDTSERYKEMIHRGIKGIKPGWVRVNFHFLMTDEEFAFICDAIIFISQYGRYFLPLYTFDIGTENWSHISSRKNDAFFGLDDALEQYNNQRSLAPNSNPPYDRYLKEAMEKARELQTAFSKEKVRVMNEDLFPYLYYDHEKED
jgi:selenocysteine lyase/cysteine desulfurase